MNYQSNDCVVTPDGHVEVITSYPDHVELLEDIPPYLAGDSGSFKTHSGYNVEFVITDIKKDAE